MIELSERATTELALYRSTGEIDATGDLYYEFYEYYANEIDVRVREDEERLYDYVLSKIKELA
jgi:hypothetical protein